ncbi:hypothetical protein E2C01_022956 [Portunus trituberculatus]|uniref:Uncharacterized protein n=1 Tax=Portunus trituberculatus TaxID=210409 RepID=A0A5B7E6R0_PORTR|nr:hypothetical protein [Portunus trituberculatus]
MDHTLWTGYTQALGIGRGVSLLSVESVLVVLWARNATDNRLRERDTDTDRLVPSLTRTLDLRY